VHRYCNFCGFEDGSPFGALRDVHDMMGQSLFDSIEWVAIAAFISVGYVVLECARVIKKI
jgi:regulator of RNase E activity RraB